MPIVITADTIQATEERGRLLGELTSLRPDFKAPVVAAELVSNDIPEELIYFRNQSTFKRQVSRDIERISWSIGMDDAENSSMLVFDLNQEGLYDMLPEAVVHTQSTHYKDPQTDVRRGIELRQQEKAARTFFSPLENEFAHRSLRLDILAREILRNDNPSRTRLFFQHFFGESDHLTDQQVVVLSYILPLCHKIRGDVALMSLAISKILGYKVMAEQHYINNKHELPEAPPLLGAGKLGIDTVLNDHFEAVGLKYHLNVEGVAARDYPHFTGNGRHARVIRFVADYFFPATAALHIILKCPDGERKITVSDNGDEPSYLGFNSYL